MRTPRLTAMWWTLLAAAIATPTLAGVPKMVFAEKFGGTWSDYCPASRCALQLLESTYGARFLHLENHIGYPDPFRTSETRERAERYDVWGVPHVRIDGVLRHLGADACSTTAEVYGESVEARLASSGGTSPVKITGGLAINGNQAVVTAYFELLDPGLFRAHQATLFLYEDDITWCCGHGDEDHWDGVVRMVRSTPASLTTVGQVVMVEEVVDLAGMNPANLHPAAVFEQIDGAMEIIQASDFSDPDYGLEFLARVESVPAANGAAWFHGALTNFGESADVVTLSVDGGFGWLTDFQVEGDSSYYENHPVLLAPGEERGITVRVRTDEDQRVSTGHIQGISQNSGRASRVPLKVFNGSPSILLVDDDGDGHYEGDFTDPLRSVGYLYETATGVSASILRGYDAVIWHTGYELAGTLTQTDQDELTVYLDSGGALLLSSMGFLSTVTLPNTFVTDYLGIAFFNTDTGAARAVGVGGDPISGGMDIPLEWPSPQANRVDTVFPTSAASTIFYADAVRPAAVRQEAGPYRTVFSTICQDAFPQASPDPNNNESVIENALAWLLAEDPAALPDALPGSSPVLTTGPNPVRGPAEIGFVLNGTGARDLQLSLMSASGRLVRSFVHGPVSSGNHRIAWDGRDDSGHLVAAGVYFVRLRTEEGASSARLLVVR